MPIRPALCLMLIALAAVPFFGQMAPLPSDPLEPVSGAAELVTDLRRRAASFDLLKRARWNFDLQASGREAFKMKISFSSNGHAGFEGVGSMDETWISTTSWRWSATFANTSQVRLANSGEIYGTHDPVPLRVQMVRSAVFWPIQLSTESLIRAAKVKIAGEKTTCLLLSGSVPGGAASRFWVETEYCIDAKTGLLKLWSEAPGIYIVYDYKNAPIFHGHTLPRQIFVHENRTNVLTIHIDSIDDAGDLDTASTEPTPEMEAGGPTFTLSVPGRFPVPVDPDPGALSWIQPVIVHAILSDRDGTVIEAEALQTSNKTLADTAIDVVRNSDFGANGMQREVFVNVQFHEPQNYNDAIFVQRVRRLFIEKRSHLARPRPQLHPRIGDASESGDHF